MKQQSFSNFAKRAVMAVLALVLVACSSAAAATPSLSAAAGNTNVATATTAAVAGATAASSLTTIAKLNLNTGSANDFLAVPNVGQRMVREFMEYRPYTSILQFRQQLGKYVDAATIAGYEEYVSVPVDANQADAATLRQLPGVDDTIANALVAARPYASTDAFLAKLGTYVSAAQVAAAKSYLAAG